MQQASVRVVCILGVARTGSSRVVSILSGFEGLFVKEEIFNPYWVATLDDEIAELCELAGIADVGGSRNKLLTGWLRAHANTTIDWLLKRAGDKPLVFKLFPGHVVDQVELHRLLVRPDIGFIAVRRRPIDVYISNLKIRTSRAMRYADTTNIKVHCKIDEFIVISSWMKNWYAQCASIAQEASRPLESVSYANEIAGADAVLVAALGEKLRKLGIDPGKFGEIRGPRLVRQDHSQSFAEKVSNWEEFSAKLRTRPDYSEAFVE